MDAFKKHHEESSMKVFSVLSESVGEENSACSAFSICNVLAMLHAGSDGETAEQIVQAISLGGDVARIRDGYAEILKRLTTSESIKLNIANLIYIHKNFDILKSFSKIMKKKFLSVPVTVNFGDAQKTSNFINSQVAEITCGKIKEVVDADSLNDMVKIIIVNALYFKGEWQEKFKARATRERDFLVSRTETVKTQMMCLEEARLNYAELSEMFVRVLELPYTGNQYSMLIILPNEVDGLQQTMQNLATTSISNILAAMSPMDVNVVLPKFKIEAQFDLIDAMKSVGIRDAFDDKCANLSKISATPNLVVSEFIHKVFVEVNEQGTEAAAASTMKVMLCCASLARRTINFTVDHPFVFFIVDRASHLILFSGKYVRPVPGSAI